MPPPHLVSTEHLSQWLRFCHHPLAFVVLTKISCITEIGMLFSNIMSWYKAPWVSFWEMVGAVCTEAVCAFLWRNWLWGEGAGIFQDNYAILVRDLVGVWAQKYEHLKTKPHICVASSDLLEIQHWWASGDSKVEIFQGWIRQVWKGNATGMVCQAMWPAGISGWSLLLFKLI